MTRVDKHLCAKLLERGLRNSQYYLESGRVAGAYTNLDMVIFGGDTDAEAQYEVISQLVDQFAAEIQEIETVQGQPIDRLAFIDKAGHGPVGTILLASNLIHQSRREGVLIRPYRNTSRSVIRGKGISAGERILIVSDVGTTGRTIMRTAVKIWEKGGIVTGALVFLDNELGARENLAAKGIDLYSLLTRSEAKEDIDPDLLPKGSITSFHEFGGVI